jgi:hypothetical protein
MYIYSALKPALIMKYIGNLTSDARGKLNGMVFTRGRYGAVIRTKVSPVQPATPAQQLVKQNFGALSASWRDLSDDDRNGWNSVVGSWQKTNVFGQQYTLSGLNLYVGLNQNLLQIEQTNITEAPLPGEMPVVQAFGITADVSSTNLQWTLGMDGGSTVPVGTNLVIEATPPISAGRTYVKNKFAQITFLAAAVDTSLQNIWPQYVARYGALVAGQVIYLRAKLIDVNTGQATIPVEERGLVVA